MAVKGSAQVTVIDVSDAYNVILTSEAYTFQGNSAGAPSGLSCTTQVVAYCGGTPCTKVTIGNITCPSGISASIASNGTVSPMITFRTTATVTGSCEATIPVVVNDVTVNKKFSFAVAKNGDDFSWNLFKGSSMTNSKLICTNITLMNSVTLSEYAQDGYHILTPSEGNANNGAGFFFSDFTTLGINVGDTITFSFDVKGSSDGNDPFTTIHIPKEGAWWIGLQSSSTLFKPTDIFQRVSVTYTIPEAVKTCKTKNIYFAIHGNYKSDLYVKNLKLEKSSVATPWTPHPDDLKGDKGATGKGISSTAITYQASSSGTTIPTGSWQTSVPSVSAGQYLWTRTVITYSDNTTSTSYSVGRMGTNGSNGSAGKGISSTAITYQAGASGTVVPTGSWSSSVPATSASAPYLWTRTIITYTDNTTSTSYSVGSTPDSISVGGRNLARGTSVEYTSPYSNFNGSQNTCLNVGLVYTKGLNVGDTLTIRIVYKYTNIVTASGQTAYAYLQGSGNITEWSAGSFPGKYIANPLSGSGEKELIYHAKLTEDNVKNNYWVVNIRHDYVQSGSVQWKEFKVEKGNIATDWTPAPEDSIASVDVEYYLSTSSTALSGGSWSTTAPAWVNGKYMWSRTVITDGAGNKTYSPNQNGVCIAGAKGDTGAKGDKGDTGSTGKGITSITEQYYKSTSATALSGGSWSTTYPGWENGKYIWTRSVITYSDNTTTTTTAVCVTGMKGDTGSKGDKGETGATGPQGPQGVAGKDANQVVHSVDGGGNTNIYVEFATVKITDVYVNRPTTFKISGRGYETTDVQFMFKSAANTDPELAFVRATGGFSVWIYKKSTSTWGLITRLNEAWGYIRIYNYQLGINSISVTWTDTRYASLPSGCTSADQLQAAKTATNFMEFTSGTGLQVGDKTNGTWKGFRTRITSSAFEVLNEVGTAVASYGRKLIELGKDATDAVIRLCGGKGIIKYEQIGIYNELKPTLTITSENVGLVSDDTVIIKSEQMDDDDTTYTSQIYLRKSGIDIATFTELSDGTVTAANGLSIDDYFGIDISFNASNKNTLSKIRLNGWTLLDYIHPVGSIYLAYNDSESPAEKFGGEWEQITGKFLYCATGTATGGSSQHSHVQTVGLDYGSGYLYSAQGATVTGSRVVSTTMCWYKYDGYGNPASTREDSTYSSYHTPPYITVYAWRRTA